MKVIYREAGKQVIYYETKNARKAAMANLARSGVSDFETFQSGDTKFPYGLACGMSPLERRRLQADQVVTRPTKVPGS